MATSTLVPKIVRFHWDDVVNQFQLVITFELETPLGNFSREVRVTIATLLGVLAEIAQVLAVPSAGAMFDAAGYEVGDKAKFLIDITAMDFAPVIKPTMPDELPHDPDTSSIVPYDGEADGWGKS